MTQFLTLILISLSLIVNPSSAQFQPQNGFFVSDNGWVIPYWSNVKFELSRLDAETESFIRANPLWFGDIQDLQLGPSIIHRVSSHIFLRRELYYNGLRLWEAGYEFRLIEYGNYAELWGVNGKFQRYDFTTREFISELDLVKLLYQRFGGANIVESIEKLYYFSKGKYRLSYFAIYRAGSTERYAVFVDCATGEFLYYVNTVMTSYRVWGNSTINYYPERPSDGYHQAPFRNGFLSVNFLYVDTTNDDGEYSIEVPSSAPNQTLRSRLQGRFVYVDYTPGPDALYTYTLTPPAMHNWEWNENIAHPDELNLYYHTDFVHRWYKQLDPGFTRMDYPVPARAQVRDMTDNAYWDGYGTNYGAIGYTGLCNNFALFSDVIYHEYTHGVTQYIYDGIRLPYEGESGAMNEAWSDYFACTINNDPLHGEGICGGPFRNLENNLRYPDDTTGEVHHDGAILSGALWKVRSRIRVSMADSLAHFARYGHATNFYDYFIDYLYTDDNDGNISDGTPNFNAIMNSFAAHGIGPGFYPQIVLEDWEFSDSLYGNGNMIPENGETLTLRFTYYHKADFPYPVARNLCLHARSLEPSTGIILNSSCVGDLEPGSRAMFSDILLVINEIIHPHFGKIALDLSAENAENEVHDTIKFPFGKIELLLVDDDGGENIESYFINALENIQTLYRYWNFSTLGVVPSDTLERYKVILWFTGNNSLPFQGENQLNHIQFYLNHGGSLILTGQYLGEYLNSEYVDFLTGYLKALHTHDRVQNYLVMGSDEFELTSGVRLLITGFPGAGNQVSQSGVDAYDGGRVIFRYQPSGIGAGTLYQDEFTVFYFGFGLEAVSSTHTSLSLEQLLAKLLNFLDIQTKVVARYENKIKTLAISGPYPNPCNTIANFTLYVPEPGNYSVAIYNIMGQKFSTIYQGFIGSEKRFYLDTNGLASGVYFINVKGIGSATKKLIVMK